MSDEAKENVNFRLAKGQKEALARAAAEQDKAVSQVIREAVESYLQERERRAWEVEARRAASALAREAEDSTSAEAEHLRALEATMEDFAEEWIWREEE